MSNPITNNPDVRMRGFTSRALVEDVLAWVDDNAHRLSAESIELADACGRILAEDIAAERNVPPFDRASMDGYAVQGNATDGAGDYNPLEFRLLGESLPGNAFAGELESGTAIRIMTGAPVPPGADAVVPAEYTTESNGVVRIMTAVSPGKHVGRIGEDVQTGSVLLHAGRRLRPQDLGVLASVGVPTVNVTRCPAVRVIITGDELVLPGETLGADCIFESNSFVLRSLIERDGGRLEPMQRVKDDCDSITAAMCDTGADVVLVSGGSSVGAEDHAPSILREAGNLAIHGVAMRPSSPVGMGRIGEAMVFLLPGNPVSCLCAYDFFAGRAIRLRGGRSSDWPYPRVTATVERKIVSAIGRVDYCRVLLNDGRVVPLSTSGASILTSTTRADGFVIVPAASEGFAIGANVEVLLYDSPSA
jgi:molybdopterin molybdotransferase